MLCYSILFKNFSIDLGIINVAEPSCTSTSVQISWTNTITNCITNYVINSTTSDSPITTSTSDTSYALNISSLSVGVYYISVAGVDTGGRTGQHSNMVSVTVDGKHIIYYKVCMHDGNLLASLELVGFFSKYLLQCARVCICTINHL